MLLISGTLPFVDNFTLLGGFVFGLLAGILFLPYITVAGQWQVYWRRGLVCVVGPGLVVLVGMVFYGFYDVQKISQYCGVVCDLLNCLPYTPNMCLLSRAW